MKQKIKKLIQDSIDVKSGLLEEKAVREIESCSKMLSEAVRKGKKVLIFGNGGSAADSQHIAAELVGRFKKERRALAAVALTTDSSILTALGNDYGYESVFARQIEALGKKGDIALGLSTSGNSRNVISALRAARSAGMTAIGLAGAGGGEMKNLCDILITVPSNDTARIQECHIMIAHIICDAVESEFCR